MLHLTLFTYFRLPATMFFSRSSSIARLLLFVLLGLMVFSRLFAAVIYVQFDADEDGEGTSWADALYSVQDALLYAQTGDEIWVSSGTYYPDYGDAVFEGDRFASFELKSGVSLYGGFAGTETQRTQRDSSVNETILSGGIGSSADGSEDSIHVVTGGDTDETAILDGVTISNGSADSGTGEYSVGGGLYIIAGSPTVSNVTFKDNEATTGGAVHVEGSSSNPIFTGCSFTGNSAFYDGGAVNSLNASPQFSNCSFSGNFALDGVGGALQVSGTGTFLATDCIFSNNESVYGGGGAEIVSTSPKFTRCTFSANTTSAGAGGGVESDQGTPEFDACIFSGNTSNYAGGGLANWSGNPVFTDTSFSSNQDSGDYGGGGVFNYQGSPDFTGCSFDSNYADYGGGLYNLDGAPKILNCNFSSNTEGTNTGLGGGGGIFNYDGAPVITGCTFSFNISAFGAGIYNYFDAVGTVNPVIVKCTFTDNSSSATEGGGSGIVNWNAQPDIYNCTFLRNTAQVGAAIWNEVDGVGGLLSNCLFANNTATDSGGAIYNPPTSVNCTFYGNTAAIGAAIYDGAGKTLTNCILYGNTATTQGNPIEATNLTINHSIVEGGYAGQSNLDADPRFTDAANTDFTLANDSPAIDVGDTASLPVDSADLDSDTNIAESLSLDLGDKVRTFREIVDMGAHEFDGNRPPAFTLASFTLTTEENQTAVATLTAADADAGDTLAFTLAGGADAALFDLASSTGVLAFKSSPDFETPGDANTDNVHELTLQVGDGTVTVTQAVTVTVTDVNDAPAFTLSSFALAAAENQTAVATLTAADADAGDTLAFTLAGGVDAALFDLVSSTGVLTFKSSPDFETPGDANTDNVHELTLQVGDGTVTVTQAVTVTVTDVAENQSPSFTSHGGQSQVALSLPGDASVVTTVIAVDPDGDELAYSLSGGVDQSLLNVDVATGQLSFKQAPDFLNPTDTDGDNIYEVTVKVTDDAPNSLSAEQSFSITVTEPETGDGDSDGLPDSWETEHGLDLASDDSGADPDGDNLSNLQEYKLGTDPKDGNSGFMANELKSNGGVDFSLTWESIPGKNYTVQSSVDLKTWSDLTGPHAAVETETSTNISAEVSLRRAFYRVVLVE
ncbi:MAG: hypothetical protein HN675_08455 [Opitutae bacterium]|nr:hypothetical protein [Opitutae bacterium]